MPVAKGQRRRRGEWGTIETMSLGRARVRWTCPVCSSPGDSVKHRSDVQPDLAAADVVRIELRAKFARDPASICTERLQDAEADVDKTVRNAYERWLAEVSAGELSPSTLRGYESMWGSTVEPRWGDREVRTVNNPGEISAWNSELAAEYSCRAKKMPVLGGCTAAVCGCTKRGKCSSICDCRCGCVPASTTSVRTAMCILSGVLGWAVEHDWGIDSNTAVASYGRRRRRRGRLVGAAVTGAGIAGVTRKNRAVATVKAAHAISKRMPDRYELIPLIACYAGLRLSEILGLRRCDINRKTSELRIIGVNVMAKGGMRYRARQKGGQADAVGRLVQIPKQLMDLIVEHLKTVDREPLAWLWPSPKPKKSWATIKCVGNRYVAQLVANAREYAGLSDAVTLPALRKTGENLVKKAVGADEAALWAGHDLDVAEDAYHLQMTSVSDPKAVREALTEAWQLAA